MLDIEKLEWIKCNLPYYLDYDLNSKPKTDWSDLEKRCKDLFGITYEESASSISEKELKYFIECQDLFSKKYISQFGKEKADNGGYLNDFWKDFSNDVVICKVKKHQDFYKKYCAWANLQKEDIKDRELNAIWLKEQQSKSFEGLGLNKIGTVLQLDNGEYYLCGTSPCEEIGKNAIVKKYALLFDMNELNKGTTDANL